MPRASFSDLFTNKPGAMVARVPTFTAGLGTLYDARGWTYVHLDEALEMLIIRLIKALNVLMLPSLEPSGAWLLVVSRARMLIRTVASATKSYRRTRSEVHDGSDGTPLGGYDRNAVQNRTVRAMVDLMRCKGFLTLEHRQTGRLRNVLADEVQDLRNESVQKLLLDIDKHGRVSAELHAAAMFPDIFGPLTNEDLAKFFEGKRLRGEWTKKRQIPTAGSVMEKERDNDVPGTAPLQDPRKALTDRRWLVTKSMTNLTLAEHAAIQGGDVQGAEHARKRWNTLHSSRYLMSAVADAYRSADCKIRHAMKNKFVSALKFGMGEAEEGGVSSPNPKSTDSRNGISFYYDFSMPQHASVMVDLMNHVWTRGTDGRRGNSIYNVTVQKLKHTLRPWFSGRRSRQLKQLHLHVDDPTEVIPQKRGEQERRDFLREPRREDRESANLSLRRGGEEDLHRLGFHVLITVPWSSLVGSRESRDATCSLHLFCGATAAMELAEDEGLDVSVFLYGGCFCIPATCVGKRAVELIPELAALDNSCPKPRQGEVIITRRQPRTVAGEKEIVAGGSNVDETLASVGTNANESRGSESTSRAAAAFAHSHAAAGGGIAQGTKSGAGNPEPMTDDTLPQYSGDLPLSHDDGARLLRVPRTRVLKMTMTGGLEITNDTVIHGEAETRFVAAFKRFVEPHLETNAWNQDVSGRTLPGNMTTKSSCVIVSKDTDVTIILGLAKRLHGKGIIHVLGENVIDIDALLHSVSRHGLKFETIATVYVLAGCDFTPGTYGISHETYLRAALRYKDIVPGTRPEVLELVTLLAYLEKHGIRQLANLSRKEELEKEWGSASYDVMEIRRKRKTVFISESEVGSVEWGLDVRRFVADLAKSASELVPLREHFLLQAVRVEFIVFNYWQKSEQCILSTECVQGCEEPCGFDSGGQIVLERDEDLRRITKSMKELVAKCRCKGQCVTRQCSCVKRNVKCVGCECDGSSCLNRFTHVAERLVEDTAMNFEDVQGEDRFNEEKGTTTVPFGLDFVNVPAINPEHDYEEFQNMFE